MLQIPTTIPQQEDDAAILHPSPSRSSSPPPYQRSVNDQQRNDLEATFDESLDANETQQLLPQQPETSFPQQQQHHQQHHHHVASTNDGVFNNISAKPDTSKDGSSGSNETPPVSMQLSTCIKERVSYAMMIMIHRLMKKQQPIPHHLTGIQQSLLPLVMNLSWLKVYLSAICYNLVGIFAVSRPNLKHGIDSFTHSHHPL